MLPILEGVIARRILVNFRADHGQIALLVPRPLEVVVQKGFAVVGICLIRLEQLRLKGTPKVLGLASENMAHRVAIRFKEDGKMKNGVFIWRRDTDQNLTALLGGRLFPGVHSKAKFKVVETLKTLSIEVRTKQGEADVRLKLGDRVPWKPTRLFKTFEDAKSFFQKGDCGFSCALDKGRLEGMRLETVKWEMEPITTVKIHTAFYEELGRRSSLGLQFDCALRMRGIPHRWHELKEIPELTART